jgi:hypothetical protein
MLRMLFAYAIHVDPTAHLINVISIGRVPAEGSLLLLGVLALPSSQSMHRRN